jgi:colicin import membrane protein
MIRTYEKEVSWKAGGLAIAVHLALLGALLISFNWKAAHPVLNVTEVELWDSIPNQAAQQPEPVEKQVLPKPVVKETPKPEVNPEPKPEPKPVVEAKPKEEPQVDIALEKKKKELALKKAEAQLKAEQIKKEKALAQQKQLDALKEEMRKDSIRENQKLPKENKSQDALKKLQQEALADEKTAGDQRALSAKAAANAGEIDIFRSKIQAKIRGNVNKGLCGDNNPELKFEIGLLPTGQLSGEPKLVKSSGSITCDEAVERAIMASEPLPLPSDASLFSQFRNLKLTFRPNN